MVQIDASPPSASRFERWPNARLLDFIQRLGNLVQRYPAAAPIVVLRTSIVGQHALVGGLEVFSDQDPIAQPLGSLL
jgi:hypothetical protein